MTEVVLNLERGGMIDQVPMFIVADLGSQGTLEEAFKVHAVKEFPAGVGRKGQEML